jgi:deoxyribose-phosphate aldolase
MNHYENTPQLDDQAIADRVGDILSARHEDILLPGAYATMLGMVDLTTLEGSDNTEKVKQLCKKAVSFAAMGEGIPNVAAVCVYPTLVATARRELDGTGIRIASVAGAFPSGLSPLKLRVEETRYAVGEGADEIDMVISRGRFLEGDYNYVYDEVAAIREACGSARLKVILETGELKTATLIRRASEIAMDAGAHFIKTSTGKVQPAATLEAMLIMLEAIAGHHTKTGKKIGIKPAGGISDAETALKFYTLVHHVLGGDWLNKDWFRFGASRLSDALVNAARGTRPAENMSAGGY